eukprot:2056303-Pyramimonas_sp.AAC.1
MRTRQKAGNSDPGLDDHGLHTEAAAVLLRGQLQGHDQRLPLGELEAHGAGSRVAGERSRYTPRITTHQKSA